MNLISSSLQLFSFDVFPTPFFSKTFGSYLNRAYIHIKYMVIVLKYKLHVHVYLGKERRKRDVERALPSPIYFFDPSRKITYIPRQLSCISFILKHYITSWASYELYSTNSVAYPVEFVTPWRKQGKKDDATMHLNVDYMHKVILGRWPDIAMVYWITFIRSIQWVVAR